MVYEFVDTAIVRPLPLQNMVNEFVDTAIVSLLPLQNVYKSVDILHIIRD